MNILNKGLNYNLHSKRNTEGVVIDVESQIQFLNESNKNIIRTDFKSTILSTNDKSTNNHKINKVLKSLKSKDVHYIIAKKINSIVILDKTDYFDRVSKMLNSGPYVPIVKTLSRNVYNAQLAL